MSEATTTPHPSKAPFPSDYDFEQMFEDLEVHWLSSELGRAIANLGYPVGMGAAPKQEHLEAAARTLFKRYRDMIARVRPSLSGAPHV